MTNPTEAIQALIDDAVAIKSAELLSENAMLKSILHDVYAEASLIAESIETVLSTEPEATINEDEAPADEVEAETEEDIFEVEASETQSNDVIDATDDVIPDVVASADEDDEDETPIAASTFNGSGQADTSPSVTY